MISDPLIRTLAHPRRLALVQALHAGPRSLAGLTATLGWPRATVWRHLDALRRQAIVDCVPYDRRGAYRLTYTPEGLTAQRVAAALAGQP